MIECFRQYLYTRYNGAVVKLKGKSMRNKWISSKMLAVVSASLVVTATALPVLADDFPVSVNAQDGANVSVSTGTLSAEGEEAYATAVDVVAHSDSQGSVKVDGDIDLDASGKNAESEEKSIDSTGSAVEVYTDASASVDVSGDVNVSVSGTNAVANGVGGMTWGSNSDITITVDGDVIVTSEDSRARGVNISVDDSDSTGLLEIGGDVVAEGKNWVIGVQMDALNGGEATAKIGGDIKATSSAEEGIGISTAVSDGSNIIQVGGDVYGSTNGLEVGSYSEGTIDVVIEGTLSGDFYPVHVSGMGVNGDVTLTVWKIVPNKDQQYVGYNAVEEYMTAEQIEKAKNDAAELEKNILYIIKLTQPNAGGSVSLGGVSDSHGFDTAKEGDTVTLKASLQNGYKVAAAYNNGTALTLKDADGNYYIVVPKGGGVSLSVLLEKIAQDTAPAPLVPVAVTTEAETASEKQLIDEFAFAAADSEAKVSFYDDSTFVIALPDGTEIGGTFAFVDGKLTFNGIELDVTIDEEDGSYHCIYTTEAGETIEFVLEAEFVEKLKAAVE